MKFNEIEISQDSPFENCTLGREKQAIVLTKLMSGFEEGGVIALNNKWGSGKTTFVKMWQAHLEKEAYTTIYFNAWVNDFEDSPLAALIAALNQKFPSGKLDKVIKFGANLGVDIGKIVAEKIVDKIIGEGTVKDVLQKVNQNVEEIFRGEIEEYNKKKKSIADFATALQSYVTNNTRNSPLIFFIDELDRCRPDYAVKLLECIKHIFTVPNIIFVLSIDKEQLAHAINGFYGSEKFNSVEYLKRFIDFEYSLLEINNEIFISNLFEQVGLTKLINRDYKLGSIHSFIKIFKIFFKHLNLRQIEKIIVHLNIILKSKSINERLVSLFYYVMYIKFMHNEFYKCLFYEKLTLEQILTQFYEIYISDFNHNETSLLDNFSVLEAELIYGYSIGRKKIDPKFEGLYEEKKVGQEFVSKINSVLIVDTLNFVSVPDYLTYREWKDLIACVEMID